MGTINIGAVIKKLRQERGMVQEQIAEYLNVSTQAVSRWETGSALPDITQVPAIANLFNCSADMLLGVDITLKEEHIKEIQKEAWNCLIASQYKEAEKILRAGIKEYPNAYTLMATLMCALYNIARLPEESKTNRKAFNEEIIALGERILAECTDDNSRHCAIQQLCYAYCDMDKHEKARLARLHRGNCRHREKDSVIKCPKHGSSGRAVFSKPVSHDMEKHRRGEAEGVEAIHDASVTLDERAVIFHAAVPFDCRHHKPAREAGECQRQ